MPERIAHCDFETRSDIDLKVNGAANYFASPHWRALILCYQIDGEPVRDWTGGPCPGDLAEHIRSGGRLRAHNAAFERHCFREMAARSGWPAPRLEQFSCTMATASALGLPRSLDKLGEALGLKIQKDKRGAALIRKFSSPRAARRGENETGPLWSEPEDHSTDFSDFVEYCRRDVLTEAEADRRMVPLSAFEQKIWELDQIINDRGLRIDRTSCKAAIRLVARAEADLDRRVLELTSGVSFRQVAALKAWCEQQGVTLNGAAKDDILEALDDDLPDHVREVLLLRQEAAKTSTRKLKAFLARASADDRIRGVFVYHGAGPGRWSSAGGVNVNNLPRPRNEFDDANIDLNMLHRIFRQADPDLVRSLYGDAVGKPTHIVADALRSFIWAAPNKELIAVDYSGIQGALTAWLAREEWKLTAMREIIADPSKPDLYRRAAAGILGTSADVITKKHWARQIGKVAELALGFAGGPSALVSMAANYGIRRNQLHDLYLPLREQSLPDAISAAEIRYARCLRSRRKSSTDILTKEGWLACSIIVGGWRAQNPAHGTFWKGIENAARDAVRSPGSKVRYDRIEYLAAHGFLWCRLPSGRCIAYASPRLKDQVWAKFRLPDGSWSEAEVAERDEAERLERIGKAKIEGATSAKVTALGVDSQSQKLTRYALYGGLITENLAMGVESDILRLGMLTCEAKNYPIVLHAYDELVAEVPRGRGSVDEMTGLMLNLPAIYEGLPLTASGWRGKRYRKS